ncbi:MAG: glycosyltransferase family 2 protein [Treponema sp.]|jgi:glycosyltransferase involved in cell wall biosynthesis|nr:glycosyltransferase family 2 protein [Treponema sp.]
MLLSIVVPCYNEEAAVPLFYAETARVLEGCAAKDSSFTAELVFVDDGSADSSAAVLKDLAARDGRVRYIIFSRNFGKEAAMLAGLREARGDAVVMLDADLQHPPSLIPLLLPAVASGEFDCAGTKRTRKGDSPLRTFFSRLFYRLMARITDIEMIDGAGDFRLMSRPYVDALLSLNERSRFSKGFYPWIGFRTIWFEYENAERAAGRTKWSFWKLFQYSLDGITAFSTKPLALASILGVLLFFISLIVILWIVVYRLITLNTPHPWTPDGWASTACIVLFCGGIQLFTTGILGQYLAKTYTEVKQRPHYVIRERS